MPTKLPGTVDDGDTVASDEIAGQPYKVLGVRIRLGVGDTDAGPVSTSNGLPIITNGDVATSFSLAQPTIGTAAVRLAIQSATRVVTVKALNGNTGTVYVGKDNTVAAGNAFELGPGESVSLPIDNVSKIWCIASAADQKICWIAV